MEYANYIARCIEIARFGEYFVAPNPMVGAVLVGPNPDPSQGRKEIILAEGWHERYGEAHAEVNCFRHAENKEPSTKDLFKGQRDEVPSTKYNIPSINYKDCTLFVSLEPCSHYGKTPPCAKLIIEKGVGRVVVGMLDPNPLVAGKGVQLLRDAGIEVIVGVMEKECRELNKRFLCLHEQHRPYVILKWAQTADGNMDVQRDKVPSTKDQGPSTKYQVQSTKELHLNGALAISTENTKALVHKMRAENMAIMVGTNTVLLDNPRLLTTHWEGRNPVRVTFDRHNRIPADARIFSDETERSWQLDGAYKTIVYRERTDWEYVLADLAAKQIHSVLVEGGTTLLNTILASGVWDEIHVEVAPELTIGEGVQAPQIALPENYESVDGHRLYTIYNSSVHKNVNKTNMV